MIKPLALVVSQSRDELLAEGVLVERKYLHSIVKYDMNCGLLELKCPVSILHSRLWLFWDFFFLNVMFIYTAAWSDIIMFPVEQETTDSTDCLGAKSNQYCNSCEG